MRKHSSMGRVAAIGLCVMMMASSANLTAYAEENGRDAENSVRATGYVEQDLKPAESIHQEGMPELLWGTDPLPPTYQTPKLPAVRNQNPYGTCWAFSSIACMEIYLMNHPEAAPGVSASDLQNIDLSELHTIYFANFSVVDPLGGTAGDSYRYTGTYLNYLRSGGSYDMAINALSDWMGAVDETKAPYENAYATVESGLAEDLAYGSDLYHLQGFRRICMTDRDDVKRAIQKYGAVGISYYDESKCYDYYNSETYGYYCDNSSLTPNHGVTLVGWDDNYSKSNFHTSPTSDGAWIVRNSWGSGFGNGGYFYLSYEDKTIGSNGNVFIAESADNYKRNYQYDGAVWKCFYFMPKYANVFTAAAPEGETLDAVSFETYSVNQTYTIKIYKNPTDSIKPETGELAATVIGTTDYAGMYTVKLNQPVYLQQGDKFAVVVSLVGADDQYGSMVADANTTDPSRECSNSGGTGKSLGYWANWYDFGEEYNTNFHIKAFTNDINPEEVVSVNGVTISSQQMTLQKGATATLTSTVTPDNASNPSVRWSSSNESVATVDAHGVVTAVSGGEAKITVTTADGGYQASCDVKAEVPLQQISLNDSSLSLNVGEESQLQVSYTPTDTTVDQTVAWSSSHTSVATVDTSGKVKAVAPGQAVITAKVGSCTAICNVTVLVPQSAEESGIAGGNGDTGNHTGNNTGSNTGNTGSNTGNSTGSNTGNNTVSGGETTGQQPQSGNNQATEQQTGWVNTEGVWYYITPEGKKTTGWLNEGGEWYFMNTDGSMATGWVNDGGTWYYMNGSGAMATGWVCDGGTWYYMNGNGSMATGWVNDGGTWYYMNGNGAMATGWVCDGGAWYYMNGNGSMATGWVCDGGAWYYMNGNGSMATGWVYSGGKWYYMKSSGAMATGWLYTGGHWYYLYDSGAMAVNTRIGRYRIGTDGVCYS